MAEKKRETALHELLAVENTLGETSNRIQKETTKVLSTKETIFSGLNKSHIIFNEADQHLVQATEIKEVQDTANNQLAYLGINLARYWNVIYQKEEANQRAQADIVVNGTIIAKNIPAIVLLGMEKKLTSLISTYNAIPTLDASKAWELDKTYSIPAVWRTKLATERQHTTTYNKWVEVSPATKEHKAQMAQESITDTIGKYVLTEYSGAITSLDKAEKLQRLNAMIRAVKTARQRANSTSVNTELKFSKTIIDYING